MLPSADPAILAFIRAQPDAIVEAAARGAAAAVAWTAAGGAAPRDILLMGCGTSLHAAQLAAYGAAADGPRLRASPAYEALVHDAAQPPPDLAVAISHSGTTEITLRAAQRLAAGGTRVAAVTATVPSPLADACDAVLDDGSGDERVPAKTKGYTASAAAARAFVEGLAGGLDARAGAARAAANARSVLSALPCAFDDLVARAREAPHLWILGAGALRGVAREGALKIVEIAGAQARHAEQEEFIHGWRRAMDRSHLVVALMPRGAAAERASALADIVADQGASLVVIQAAAAPVAAHASLTVGLPVEAGDDAWHALPYAVPLQLLAYAMAAEGDGYRR